MKCEDCPVSEICESSDSPAMTNEDAECCFGNPPEHPCNQCDTKEECKAYTSKAVYLTQEQPE